MKKILLILIAISLIGCKAKTINVESHTTDTLRIEKIAKKTSTTNGKDLLNLL